MKCKICHDKKFVWRGGLGGDYEICECQPPPLSHNAIVPSLNELCRLMHEENRRWWHCPITGEKIDRNKGEMIALMHSELSEALEGERKNLMDDKLPHRRAAEVELADVLIRIFDYAGAYEYDLGGALFEKVMYNRSRQDHTYEARAGKHGKKF